MGGGGYEVFTNHSQENRLKYSIFQYFNYAIAYGATVTWDAWMTSVHTTVMLYADDPLIIIQANALPLSISK